MIHIHQGGTLHAYCGLPLVDIFAVNVAWEDAPRATCPACLAFFAEA